jgi:hypothetical protein
VPKKDKLKSSKPCKKEIVAGYLVMLLLGLLACVYFLTGCHKTYINPPIEERVFFTQDWKCILSMDRTLTCSVPEGIDLNQFMIIGEKRWFDDQNLLDECEDRGLIQKEPK